MEEIATKISELGLPFLLNIVAAIIIYIVGKWLAKVFSAGVEQLLLKGNVDQALAFFTKNIVKAAILIFAIIAAVGRLGVQTMSFIAILGAAGLAVGMALQGTLSNFAAGVYAYSV